MDKGKKQKGSAFRGPFVVSTVRAPKPCLHNVQLYGVPLFYWKTLSSRCVDAFGVELSRMVPCGRMEVSPLKVLTHPTSTREKALSRKLLLGVPVEVLVERPYGPCALFANLRGYSAFYRMSHTYIRWFDKCAKSLGLSWPVYLCLSCLGNVSNHTECYNQSRQRLALKVVDWLESVGGCGVCSTSSDLFETVWSGCNFEENGVVYRRPPSFMFLLPLLKPVSSGGYKRLFSALWDQFFDLYTLFPFYRVYDHRSDVKPKVDAFVDLVRNRLFGPALYLYMFDFNAYSFSNKQHLLEQYHLSLSRCSHANRVEFIDYVFTNTPSCLLRTVEGLDYLLRWLLFSVRDQCPKKYEAFIDLQGAVGDNGECYPGTLAPLFAPDTTEKGFFFSLRYDSDVIAQFTRCVSTLASCGNVWGLFYLCSITHELHRYDRLVRSLFSNQQLLRRCWSSLWLDILGMPFHGFTLDVLRLCSMMDVFPLEGGLGDGDCDPVLETWWWTSSLPTFLCRFRNFMEERRCGVDRFYSGFFTKFKGLLGQYSELLSVWESWFTK